MECLFSECNAVKVGALPQDLNVGAVTGERISMKNLERVAIKISFAAGANDIVGTMKQHDAAAAGNSKVLASINPYFTKVDAETAFTKVEPSSEISVYTIAGGTTGVAIIEVLAEELDRTYGAEFAYVSMDFGATAAAKIVSVDYISHKPERKPAYELNL